MQAKSTLACINRSDTGYLKWCVIHNQVYALDGTCAYCFENIVVYVCMYL